MTEEERKKQSPYAVDADTLYSRLRSDRPTYSGANDQKLADLYNQISTRPGFQYDVTKDPLYQQYKGQYIQQGKLAMKDTMGQAAALTGGYGSSYGQQVGQQAYDAYLQNLGAVVPELYSQAYGRYNDEGDRLLQQYSLLNQQRDVDYGQYRDQVGDWENERAYQTQMENQEYNRQQNNYSNLYKLIGAAGYNPTDEELAAAGMSREAADALRTEYLRANGLLVTEPTYYYGGSGKTLGGDEGTTKGDRNTQALSAADMARITRNLRVLHTGDERSAYLDSLGLDPDRLSREQLDQIIAAMNNPYNPDSGKKSSGAGTSSRDNKKFVSRG